MTAVAKPPVESIVAEEEEEEEEEERVKGTVVKQKLEARSWMMEVEQLRWTVFGVKHDVDQNGTQ